MLNLKPKVSEKIVSYFILWYNLLSQKEWVEFTNLMGISNLGQLHSRRRKHMHILILI